MKKILISVIIVLLIAVVVLGLMGKIKIGNVKLLGIQDIKNSSEELDNTIEEISRLTSITYPSKMSELNSEGKKLLTAKQDYQNKVTFSSESDIEQARQILNYEIEALWIKMGLYAEQEGLGARFLFTSGSTSLTRNLNVTVTGQYISITDFISDLENDDELGFKIENFKMVPNANGNLTATFIVRDLYVNAPAATSTTTEENTTNTEDENTNTSTGNTTNETGNNTVDNTNNATS